MAGLYIHIPFCKQACHYCDFHFSTNQQMKDTLVNAICQEISMQHAYLGSRQLDTIYLGGGTPSLLTQEEIHRIFNTILTYFTITDQTEITLEANPDDLDRAKIQVLRQTPINRLSIGIQSFYEPHLVYMNRSHNAQEAETCIKEVQDAGFEAISIDLIYGIPHIDHSVWEQDLQKAITLNVPHISAYCLTVEPKTVFGKWVKQKKMQPLEEEFSALQFERMLEMLESQGFEQYEISNFARNGRYARHNTGYWLQKKYLGVGPSAHSYNGISRQYNISNNTQYYTAIKQGTIPCSIEELTISEQINDYLLTSLRTSWGCNLKVIQEKWQYDVLKENNIYIQECYRQGFLMLQKDILLLTKSGKLLADEITASLMCTD